MPEHQIMPPVPYFGGKRNAAAAVWDALGDTGGYIEPFAGSAAVLLGRPPADGPRVETINDADGLLINAWRAIKHDPEGVIREGFDPVSEVDLHARAAWLAEWRASDPVPWLEGDPEAFDTKAAAWWLYVSACSIGGGSFRGGPWHVEGGRLVRTSGSSRGISRSIPHVGGTARGMLRTQPAHYGESDTERALEYMKRIQARLIRVRIVAGDWERALLPSILNLRVGPRSVGVFLDPPYIASGNIYQASSGDTGGISRQVLAWCKTAAPDLRIVLAGYGDDNDELLDIGWRKVASIGGQGSGFSADSTNGRRERMWLSPACRSEHLGFDLEGLM